MNENLANKIQIFKSVFKGREDVFAIRWENGNKSGYMPAYFYDPYMYRAHKMKGGTFQNYNKKTLEIALQSRVVVLCELYESGISGESGIRTHGPPLGGHTLSKRAP